MRFMPARLCAICVAVLVPLVAGDQSLRLPLPVAFENSAEYGWLKKTVLEKRVLDDLSDPNTWSFQGQGRMTFPSETAIEGMRHLRVEVNIHDQQPAVGRSSGLPAVAAVRSFSGEDWRRFNRVSFQIRPRMSGFHVLSLLVVLRNDGEEKVPDVYRREGNHYVTLPNNRWTHVVWEITPLARDKVTSLEFRYWVNKRIPDATDRVEFEIGGLELQRVKPDHFEGWNVAPDAISFSHTGYQLGMSKTAVSSSLEASEFYLLNVETGETPLRKPVRQLKTRLGEFQEIDFSEVHTPGRYVIVAGNTRTRPFRIDRNAWRETIWKTINFFYGERCGMEIPGLHDACHRDWQAVLDDRRIVMNGGWHDAGDLSQGAINTAEATYAMFALAERLQGRAEDPDLLERLIEEANWGLDWLLKVRFPGGYRIGFAGMNIWTNGIIGDADDRTRVALNNPNVNYLAATAGAAAYHVLKRRDPERAARALAMAEEDWRFAVKGEETPETQSTPAYAATEMELASVGILASLELYRATKRQEYAEKALELAPVVVNSQQRNYVGRGFPLAGFFYTSPAKKELFHQFHRGNDQAPIVAMVRLCELFPHHADWMQWYSVVALYSEYQKSVAETTQPYAVLPAYVYRDSDYLHIAEGDRYQSSREAYREQVLQGMPMGDGYYLKAFPVWFARRGNFGVLLSQAKGLSAGAHLRGDLAAARLADRQLQWVVGRNPFAQSTMWGEGYDFAQQYSVSSGDIVGSLPVGIMTRGNSDAPYWPAQNCYVYKEVWVHPSARWLWLMQDLAGPALVEGRVPSGSVEAVTFEDAVTGQSHSVEPDPAGSTFRAFLPAGHYRVRWDKQETAVTLLPGGRRTLDFRPGQLLDFTFSTETTSGNQMVLVLTAAGSGKQRFTIRTHNLKVAQPAQEVDLQPGRSVRLKWEASVHSNSAAWVAVVVPNDDLSQRKELYGRGRPPQPGR